MDNAKKNLQEEERIIEWFKNRIFPPNYDKREEQEPRDKEEENSFIDYKKHERLINLTERDINNELVRKHFSVQDLGPLLEKFKKLKK